MNNEVMPIFPQSLPLHQDTHFSIVQLRNFIEHSQVAQFIIAPINTYIIMPTTIILHLAYMCFVVSPLRQLYLRGWWRNIPLVDICAALTNHRSQFWLVHSTACAEIVYGNFDSWLAYFEYIAYFVVVFYAVYAIMYFTIARICRLF